MSTTTAHSTTSAIANPSSVPRRARTVLRSALAFCLLMAGIAKLSGTHQMVQMFREIGVGQWFRYLVGALEISGAIGLALRPVRDIAALAVTGLMVGATLTNLFVIHTSPILPIAFLAASATLARASRPYNLKALVRA
jgi:uncharacterized membrane protein YphA (DoxX/SURF4 family)